MSATGYDLHDAGGRAAAYSPERRTALVFTGTGAHGAYHAGALRAIQEAGVKIDVVAGHGIGAAAATLAAIDGGSRLWDTDGIWSSTTARAFYSWKSSLRASGWMAVLLGLVLVAPLAILAVSLIIFFCAFLLTLLGLDAGPAMTAAHAGWLQNAFASENVPTIVPRLAMVLVAALVAVAGAGVILARRRGPARRWAGRWWWHAIAAPLDPGPVRDAFSGAIWSLIKGAAGRPPKPHAAGRRYAEVLGENLGQPGFREIITVVTDMDSRRDLVMAMLREEYRREFLMPRPWSDRRGDVLDLAGPGRDHAIEILTAALTPPVAADPALMTFSPDGFWRGETHRACDRPGAILRLLEELAAAGVAQVVVVTATSPTYQPHHLVPPRLDPRHRLGDFLVAAECAALRDALERMAFRFDSMYVVSPPHNPIGPFDFAGAYDPASDRMHELTELLDQGYNDAYRQFIEPIVGASGDALVATSH